MDVETLKKITKSWKLRKASRPGLSAREMAEETIGCAGYQLGAEERIEYNTLNRSNVEYYVYRGRARGFRRTQIVAFEAYTSTTGYKRVWINPAAIP